MQKITLQRDSTKDNFVLIVLFVASFIAIILSQLQFPNSDTYFLIATGKHIANEGIPKTNPFVIHEGLEMIAQQWLFSLLTYWLYDALGNFGLYAYSLIVGTATAFAIYKFLGIYTKSQTAKLLSVAMFLCCSTYNLIVRPSSMSFLLLLAIVFIMETNRQTKNKKLLFLLPLISLLLVNLHSAMWPFAFVLTFPFLCPFDFSEPIAISEEERKSKNKNMVCVLIAIVSMFLTGFINPYGIRGMFYVILSYAPADSLNIAELRDTTIMSRHGFLFLISAIGTFWYYKKNKENVIWPLIYMSIGTLILAMMHFRNVWFLFFGGLPIVAILLGDVEKDRNPDDQTTFFSQSTVAKISIGALVLLIASFVAFLNPRSEDLLNPVSAADYLDTKNKEEIVLYTGFNNGAYMEMRGYQVYIDARPELYSPSITKSQTDILQEYQDVISCNIDVAQFIKYYGFTHMIVDNETALAGYMQQYPNAEVVVETETYKLYELTHSTSPLH